MTPKGLLRLKQATSTIDDLAEGGFRAVIDDPTADREAVRRQVEYAIEHAAPGGGLVLTSGNSIMATVRYENYVEMLAALRDYGAYPIRMPVGVPA